MPVNFLQERSEGPPLHRELQNGQVHDSKSGNNDGTARRELAKLGTAGNELGDGVLPGRSQQLQSQYNGHILHCIANPHQLHPFPQWPSLHRTSSFLSLFTRK
eukprot:6561737-Pyramimonas_sp.AAC.1